MENPFDKCLRNKQNEITSVRFYPEAAKPPIASASKQKENFPGVSPPPKLPKALYSRKMEAHSISSQYLEEQKSLRPALSQRGQENLQTEGQVSIFDPAMGCLSPIPQHPASPVQQSIFERVSEFRGYIPSPMSINVETLLKRIKMLEAEQEQNQRIQTELIQENNQLKLKIVELERMVNLPQMPSQMQPEMPIHSPQQMVNTALSPEQRSFRAIVSRRPTSVAVIPCDDASYAYSERPELKSDRFEAEMSTKKLGYNLEEIEETSPIAEKEVVVSKIQPKGNVKGGVNVRQINLVENNNKGLSSQASYAKIHSRANMNGFITPKYVSQNSRRETKVAEDQSKKKDADSRGWDESMMISPRGKNIPNPSERFRPDFYKYKGR
eukprot:TRINITY_DN2245_c0_g1_i2.p1 TRINITY_DN2245_c0_g1~~TRINITY_DN2245_c0_g1_i2.p1  ORF type:complete len:382 (+),score=73.35 TRINITY_DN2245_c0_g1_i2:128-1273(+)